MAAIDYTIAKTKISNYVDNAKDIDELVLICKKFLEKYNPEVFKPPVMSPYEYGDFVFKDYNRGNETKILEVGVAATEMFLDSANVHKKLSLLLAEEILRTNMIEMKNHKDPMTYQTIYRARIGVCKP